ncbi:MAG: N,N-dimethylformamidase beta subunit family domain-containing protein, partial [Bryobacteraceae bacterium]
MAENCLPGNPSSEWDTSGAGDPTIQGFATDISVNAGQTIQFKIETNARSYQIVVYRMGYYDGMGARKVAAVLPSATLPQTQPACLTGASTKLIDCGNWAVSASWTVPANAASGIYFVHLIRGDTGGDSHIVFIVRNDSSHSGILFQTADESWQAYNAYGGESLYGGADTFDLPNRADKVSYNRPFITRGFSFEAVTWLFGAEYPMVRWLEANGYDVTYFTGVDAARNGTLIANHKVYLTAGHDEYWSGPHRNNVQAALASGVNLAMFSGNDIFWKTRWENSIDGTNTPYRTLVCYKETLAGTSSGGVPDPADPPTWTGTWRDTRSSPPADGGRPENALTGTLFMVNGPGDDNDGSLSIQVPAADGKMRFWRNTAVASLAPGATYTLPHGTLGYEWDEDVDNGSRPPGTLHLSTATHALTSDLLLDYGATYGAGTATHSMVMYRAPSGALVFDAGTVQWSWGLDSNHDNPFPYQNPAPDPNMQQAMVNLLADMGVQPGTIQLGLVPAAKSTDTSPPASIISSPAGGSTVIAGTPTITGTAVDYGGGLVGGVEVSVDGGKTWHPAAGRGNWSYNWNAGALGPANIMSRAVDDSGNLESPSPGVSVTVVAPDCPCEAMTSSSAPAQADSLDGNSVEVGVKFQTYFNGYINGIRFYKSAANKGTHIGNLWTTAGTLLARATFTNETGSGWQQVNFANPVAVVANTTYVASYFAP